VKRARSGASNAGEGSKRARGPGKSTRAQLVSYLVKHGSPEGKKTSAAEAKTLTRLGPRELMRDAGQRLEANAERDLASLRTALDDQAEATERVRAAAERAEEDLEGLRLYFASVQTGAALMSFVEGTGADESEEGEEEVSRESEG
jgi:D-serine deaminase-like pyridoxal phosphate-dependent protein